LIFFVVSIIKEYLRRFNHQQKKCTQMDSKNKNTILMQGLISEWTSDIVNEYLVRFPDTRILVSTWTTENVEKINCEIIQTKPPEVTKPHKSTVNYQIIGTSEGLKKINKDGIILKCRTDQFIHNSKIFEIFEKECPKNKIMIPNHGTFNFKDYRTSDFCQVATKKILEDYWLNIPTYDGQTLIDAASYLTQNYVRKIKRDKESWATILQKYFFIKDYHDVFQIEWEKLNKNEIYQDTYKRSFPLKIGNE
jgi:hypothetical protein